MDTNMDGKVTFDEFQLWCEKDPERLHAVAMFDTIL